MSCLLALALSRGDVVEGKVGCKLSSLQQRNMTKQYHQPAQRAACLGDCGTEHASSGTRNVMSVSPEWRLREAGHHGTCLSSLQLEGGSTVGTRHEMRDHERAFDGKFAISAALDCSAPVPQLAVPVTDKAPEVC